MAGLVTGNKNRTGLVQCQYRFEIPGIEGVLERKVIPRGVNAGIG